MGCEYFWMSLLSSAPPQGGTAWEISTNALSSAFDRAVGGKEDSCVRPIEDVPVGKTPKYCQSSKGMCGLYSEMLVQHLKLGRGGRERIWVSAKPT